MLHRYIVTVEADPGEGDEVHGEILFSLGFDTFAKAADVFWLHYDTAYKSMGGHQVVFRDTAVNDSGTIIATDKGNDHEETLQGVL